MVFKRRGFFKDKSCEAMTTLVIWSLLASAMVILILLGYVFNYSRNHVFEQRFLVRDLSLVVEASQLGPGDLTFDYNINISKFDINMSVVDNLIMTYPIGKEDLKTIFWFSNTKLLNLTFNNEKPNLFFIDKNQTHLVIRLV